MEGQPDITVLKVSCYGSAPTPTARLPFNGCWLCRNQGICGDSQSEKPLLSFWRSLSICRTIYGSAGFLPPGGGVSTVNKTAPGGEKDLLSIAPVRSAYPAGRHGKVSGAAAPGQ